MKFEVVRFDDVDWASLDAFEDRRFSQRRAWLEFIRDTQGGEIVVARLDDAGACAGYFTGVIVRRFGVRIMGSPFPGWTTRNLGFNLVPGVSRVDALGALLPFVFRELGCLHVELADPFLTRQDVEPFGFEAYVGTTFVSDMSPNEDALFAGLSNSTRRNIRRSERNGVSIEEAAPEGFADEYYEHLIDVFAKQGLRPTYDLGRVEQLVQRVHPSGDLLLLRARDADGLSIATGISAGYGRHSYSWGSASLRAHQSLCPNEPLHWMAMRTWKARGVRSHDWGGGGDYKQKYGGTRAETLHFRLSRLAAIGTARNLAHTAFYLPRRIKQTLHRRSAKPST